MKHYAVFLHENEGQPADTTRMWSGHGETPEDAWGNAHTQWELSQPDFPPTRLIERAPGHDADSRPQEAPGDDATPETGE